MLGNAESGCGLPFNGVRGRLRLMELEVEPRRRCVRRCDSAERKDTGDPVAEGKVDGCSELMMRCPAAAILGCTGLPALRFRPVIGLPSEPGATFSSVMLLFVRDRVLSDEYVELMASSKLCTPYELSLALLIIEALPALSSPSELAALDIFRPLSAPLVMSLSLLRKKVVGPEGPGFVIAGGCPPVFFAFRVRCGESCDELIVLAPSS